MSDTTPQPPFAIPPGTTLGGVVAMIVCWWWDDEFMLDTATYAVSLVPDLLMGDTEDFDTHEWWFFAAALGAYSPRTPELDELHVIALRGFKGELPPEPTKSYVDDVELLSSHADESDDADSF